MAQDSPLSHPKRTLQSADIHGFESLAELALDMRGSWNHVTDRVWWRPDPGLWELTHNPWVVLQTVSSEKFQQALADPAFRSAGCRRSAMNGYAAEEPEHDKNDHYQAQNASEPRPSISPVPVIATAAAEQQEDHNNQQD